MSRRRLPVIVLISCCLLLGGATITTAVPASASSSKEPGQLIHQFPLGPKRLCCQTRTTSHTQTAAGSGPGGSSAATVGRSSGATAVSRRIGHASSGGTPVAIWIAVSAAVAMLSAAGVVGVRRARRAPAPVRPAGLGAVAYATAAAAPAPAPATAAASDEPHFRRLDLSGDPGGAFNLGVLLHRRGDIAGAKAAYERAEERGDPDAAFNLGVLLYETGNLAGARAAWQRSVERGHVRAAANLVFLASRHRSAPPGELPGVLQQQRSGDRSEMADEIGYRRADERGGAQGAFNLGVVLHQRGDVTGAMAAYRRAEQRGYPDAPFNLGVLLYEAGDLDGAEASWQRSADRGNLRATENLAFLVRRHREQATAALGREEGDR